MSKTSYFLRKKNMVDIERAIKDRYNIEPCYKTRKELIFKNNVFLLQCKKSYISVLIYDEANEGVGYELEKEFSTK